MLWVERRIQGGTLGKIVITTLRLDHVISAEYHATGKVTNFLLTLVILFLNHILPPHMHIRRLENCMRQRPITDAKLEL